MKNQVGLYFNFLDNLIENKFDPTILHLVVFGVSVVLFESELILNYTPSESQAARLDSVLPFR